MSMDPADRLFVHDKDRWMKNMRSREIGPAQVREYENALILPLKRDPAFATPDGVWRGGVVDENGMQVAGRRRRHSSPYANYDCVGAYEVDEENITRRDETVVFGGCLIDHFGHALVDGTARMWWLSEAPRDMRIVFLRYPTTSHAPFDALRLVELMGVDMSRVEVLDRPTRFARVIVPDETVHPMDAYRPEWIRVFDRIRGNVSPGSVRRVYLSRRQYSFRTCLNEEYYEDFFTRRGYTVVHPETLPLREQIACVSGAKQIVVTVGSMSHLLLFADPGATVTILNRSGQCLTAQIIVDQARGIAPYYVDAYLNPLPVPHVDGPFLFGPNRFFKAYLDARGISYEPGELTMDDRRLVDLSHEFLDEWRRLYANPKRRCSPGHFSPRDIGFYAQDVEKTYTRLVTDILHDPDEATRILSTDDQMTRLREENQRLKESDVCAAPGRGGSPPRCVPYPGVFRTHSLG